VLEQDCLGLSEAIALRLQSWEAPHLSKDLGQLIANIGVPGGSRPAGLRFWASRMLPLEIGPTISRLLLAIIAICVRHLWHGSYHLGFQTSLD
jgi:hypothetical protein